MAIAPNPPKSGLSDNSFIAAIAYFGSRPGVLFSGRQTLQQEALCAIPRLAVPRIQRLCHSLLLSLEFYHPVCQVPWASWLLLWSVVGVGCLAVFLLWLWCLVGALNGKRCKLPILGDWADEQAYR